MENAQDQPIERRENYPSEVFRRLEMQLSRVRNEVVRLATEKASTEQSGEVYTISVDHQDAVLRELVVDSDRLCQLLGLESQATS